MGKSYNPCDDCEYSVSKQNQESGMCKICEFKKAQTASSYMGIAQSKFKAELDAYKTAEEQGVLLRLPCKEGTTVYVIENECEGDMYDCSHDCEHCGCFNTFVAEEKFEIGWIDCIGVEVFLTREEAESALAEKGGVE